MTLRNVPWAQVALGVVLAALVVVCVRTMRANKTMRRRLDEFRLEKMLRRGLADLCVPPEAVYCTDGALREIAAIRREAYLRRGLERFRLVGSSDRGGWLGSGGSSVPTAELANVQSYSFERTWLADVSGFCRSLAEQIRSGSDLGTYLREHPRVFDRRFRLLVEALLDARDGHARLRACDVLAAMGDRTERMRAVLASCARDRRAGHQAAALLKRLGWEDLLARDAPVPLYQGPSSGRDDFGDPLPAGAVRRLGTIRLRHGGTVRQLGFSLDGEAIAGKGMASPSLRAWDAATGRPASGRSEQDFHFSKFYPSSVASPCAKFAARKQGRGLIEVIDLRTKKPVGPVVAYRGILSTMALSPGGRLLALASGEEASVRVYDTASGRSLLARLDAEHTGQVYRLVDVPAKGLLVSAARDRTIRAWDTNTWKVVLTIHSPLLYGSRHMAATAAGDTLAFDSDGKIIIRRIAGRDDAQAELPGSPPFDLSPDGRLLACAGPDATVCVRQVPTGRLVWRFWHGHAVLKAVRFAPFGSAASLVTAGEYPRVRLWYLSKPDRRPITLDEPPDLCSIAFGPDVPQQPHLLAAAGCHDIHVWDIDTCRTLLAIRTGEPVIRVLAFAPDGGTLAAGDADGCLRLWDARTGRQLARLRAHAGPVNDLLFGTGPHPRLISCGGDTTIVVWDLEAIR